MKISWEIKINKNKQTHKPAMNNWKYYFLFYKTYQAITSAYFVSEIFTKILKFQQLTWSKTTKYI